MKNTIQIRLLRGYFGLLFFKLLLLTSILVVQSCSSIHEDSAPEDLLEYKITEYRNSVIENGLGIIDSPRFAEWNDTGYQIENIDKEEALRILEPLVIQTKEFLFELGLTDKDFIDGFGTKDDPRIVLIGLVLILKNKQETERIGMNFEDLFFNSAHAQDWSDTDKIMNCAAIALGIDLITSLASIQGGSTDKWTKKALKKLIGKVATRMMGPIGVAITVGSFVLCMNDWD